MSIENKTKSTTIAVEVKTAKKFLEKTQGLLSVENPHTLFMKTRWGIHTFSMKFPIDVIICDKNWQVKTLKESLLPNKFFFWNPRYPNLLELPPGTIRTTYTQLGDQLACEEKT